MGNESGRAVSPEELQNRANAADDPLKRNQPKGETYNLKVLLRGDRHTGKSCLFNILQGKGFLEEYHATREIQIAHINWEYRASYDVVRVEVWDVVDRARVAPKTKDGLKIAAGSSIDEGDDNGTAVDTAAADAYRGAQAVVMLIDPTKKWTYDYAQRELPKIPAGVSVLVLANFRDQGEKWVVSAGELKDFARRSGAEYAESALVNSFGLRSVQLFLNLPFLKQKVAMIEAQLKRSQEEVVIAQQELQLVTAESNYARFVKWLAERKQSAGQTTPTASSQATRSPASSTAPAQRQVPPSSPATTAATVASRSVAAAPAAATPPGVRKPQAAATPTTSAQRPAATTTPSSTVKSPPPPAQKSPSAAAAVATPPAAESGFLSRMFGFSSAPTPPAAAESPKPKAPAEPRSDPVADLQKVARSKAKSSATIDDFKPVVSTLDDFFSDEPAPPPKAATRAAPRQQIIAAAHLEDDENELVTRDEVPAVIAAPPVVKPAAPTPVKPPAAVTQQPAAQMTPPASQPPAAQPKPAAPTVAPASQPKQSPQPQPAVSQQPKQQSPPPQPAVSRQPIATLQAVPVTAAPVAAAVVLPPVAPVAKPVELAPTPTPAPTITKPASSIFDDAPPAVGGDLDDFLNDDTPAPPPAIARPQLSAPREEEEENTFSSFGSRPFAPPVRAVPPPATRTDPALSQAALAALAAAQAAALAEASQFESLPDSLAAAASQPVAAVASDAPPKKKKPKVPGEKKKTKAGGATKKKKAPKAGGDMEILP